jgi:hypothetical protein
MPSTIAPPFLFDAFGRPAAFSPVGALYKRTAADDRLRPAPPNHFADYAALLAPGRYKQLVSECRAVSSRGLSAALLEQKSDYVSASGFRPRFSGMDTAWGTEASEALEEALRICNVRGPRFDWRASWRLCVPTRATDGRFFVLLTKWPDSGWPALQFLEGHRIGQRDVGVNIVGAEDARTRIVDADGKEREVRGAYAGLQIHNGVIVNKWGAEVAYRVLGPTPADDLDISARDMIQVASPQRFSEGTPVPDIARALLDFVALDIAQTAQLDQQIADSKQTFLEWNETGRPDPVKQLAGMDTPKTMDGTPTEMVERGNYRYLKSGVGRLEAFQSQRPSDQWMNFDARVASRAAAAIRWRVEMLDPTALRGAATRAFQDQINTAIMDEFASIAPAAVRVLGYFVSCLIQVGRLRSSPEWMKWTVAPPPWFEVDRASSRIDIEDVAAGRLPMAVLHARDGHTTEEVYTARAQAYEKAVAIQKRFPNVPLEVIMGDLGVTAQRSGVYQQPGGAAAAITESAA